MDQTYAYGSNGKMSKIIDAKKNGYQIAYTGEKAERFIRPNGEYQQLSYGDGNNDGIFSQGRRNQKQHRIP